MSSNNELPLPLRGSEFADEYIAHLHTTVIGDEAGIATMQFEMQHSEELSVVYSVLTAMIDSKRRGVDAKLIIDGRYVDTMTRIGNRDYPDILPLTSKSARRERRESQLRTAGWLQTLDGYGMLIRDAPSKPVRGYVPRLRQIGSIHLAQQLSTRHMKAAYVARTRGDVTAWLGSANFTDSDLTEPDGAMAAGMHNLLVRVHGQAAAFVMRSVSGGFGGTSGLHVFPGSEDVLFVHDIGNAGEPARLPRILSEALLAIDPLSDPVITNPFENPVKQPRSIVLLSQYPPDGLLYRALEHADRVYGADVHTPLEPVSDYRETAFPYNILNARYQRRKRAARISSPHRTEPSHSKILIVTYDDTSAKVILGSDNFTTHLQKAVRNEELAVVIPIKAKDASTSSYFRNLVTLLSMQSEISDPLRDRLLADVPGC
ncbi:MAG: hypothetical protein JWM81_110 [Candidatus Saccharibacteria bacterium]|nr:hypothetical protein [Candidatus Saccharibacteria bacterium]